MADVPKYQLRRGRATSDGVFGFLYLPAAKLHTLEEEQQANKPRISCIPAGTYRCKRRRYHKGGYDTFEITGVPGRELILFHILNTEEGTDGCIGVGMGTGVFEVIDEDTKQKVRKQGITQSKVAHALFMKKLEGVAEFDLEVIDP